LKPFDVEFWGPQLSAYLDGELSPADLRAVEQLLAESAEARQLLEELRAVAEGLAALPRVAAPDTLSAAMRAAAERQMLLGPAPPHPRRRVVRLWWISSVSAAAALLLVAVGVWRFMPHAGPQLPTEPAPSVPGPIVSTGVQGPVVAVGNRPNVDGQFGQLSYRSLGEATVPSAADAINGFAQSEGSLPTAHVAVCAAPEQMGRVEALLMGMQRREREGRTVLARLQPSNEWAAESGETRAAQNDANGTTTTTTLWAADAHVARELQLSPGAGRSAGTVAAAQDKPDAFAAAQPVSAGPEPATLQVAATASGLEGLRQTVSAAAPVQSYDLTLTPAQAVLLVHELGDAAPGQVRIEVSPPTTQYRRYANALDMARQVTPPNYADEIVAVGGYVDASRLALGLDAVVSDKLSGSRLEHAAAAPSAQSSPASPASTTAPSTPSASPALTPAPAARGSVSSTTAPPPAPAGARGAPTTAAPTTQPSAPPPPPARSMNDADGDGTADVSGVSGDRPRGTGAVPTPDRGRRGARPPRVAGGTETADEPNAPPGGGGFGGQRDAPSGGAGERAPSSGAGAGGSGTTGGANSAGGRAPDVGVDQERRDARERAQAGAYRRAEGLFREGPRAPAGVRAWGMKQWSPSAGWSRISRWLASTQRCPMFGVTWEWKEALARTPPTAKVRIRFTLTTSPDVLGEVRPAPVSSTTLEVPADHAPPAEEAARPTTEPAAPNP
jgi:hypothetical protein